MPKSLFIFIMSMCIVVYGDQTDEEKKKSELMETMRQCNETFVTEVAYVVSLFQNGSFPDESNKNPKCYVKCVLDKMGVMDESGNINVDETIKIISAENENIDIKDIATNCAADRNEQCKCEKSYMFIKCVIQDAIEKYKKLV